LTAATRVVAYTNRARCDFDLPAREGGSRDIMGRVRWAVVGDPCRH
jgi:hypothetical protein